MQKNRVECRIFDFSNFNLEMAYFGGSLKQKVGLSTSEKCGPQFHCCRLLFLSCLWIAVVGCGK